MIMRSTKDWQSSDIAHYLHPFTDHKALAESATKAKIFASGAGCDLIDSDGNRYLDGFAGLACAALGYGRSELGVAAQRQMAELSYANSFFKCANKPAIELAERLAALAPAGLEHVFFANSGSEANDTALRMVRHFWALKGQPQRRVVISRETAYHGSTIASGALSGMGPIHAQEAKIPDVVHIRPPYQFKYGRDMDEESFGRLAASWLEEKILEIGANRVAAFFAEPIQGAGGGKIPPRNYFLEIERICRKHDVLLVLDEVITGFGRTGHWFAAEYYGLREVDLMCLAKGITSGYIPLSAVLVGQRVAQTLIDEGGEFYHGFTSSGHPVSCAVALENLRILEEEGIIENVRNSIGPYFSRRLAELKSHPLVAETRSVGLIGAVEVVRSRATMAPIEDAERVCERIRDIGFANGIIVRPIQSTIVLAPPLIISPSEIDFLVDRLRRSLDEFGEYLISQGQ
jgi:putrescine---pyruvate transaminase